MGVSRRSLLHRYCRNTCGLCGTECANPCTSSPCLHGATCNSVAAAQSSSSALSTQTRRLADTTFQCTCPPGYAGLTCAQKAVAIGALLLRACQLVSWLFSCLTLAHMTRGKRRFGMPGLGQWQVGLKYRGHLLAARELAVLLPERHAWAKVERSVGKCGNVQEHETVPGRGYDASMLRLRWWAD